MSKNLELKIENTETIEAIEAPQATPELTESVEAVQETVSELAEVTKEAAPPKPDKKSVKKNNVNIVQYAGNGVWIDKTGAAWARSHSNVDIKSERRYSDAEFADRDDLKFMIEYGAMILIEA